MNDHQGRTIAVANKLQRLRDSNTFAANERFRVGPKMSEHEIATFETQYAVSLPPAYRMFLLHVGNGGVGPGDSLDALVPLGRSPALMSMQSGGLVATELREPFDAKLLSKSFPVSKKKAGELAKSFMQFHAEAEEKIAKLKATESSVPASPPLGWFARTFGLQSALAAKPTESAETTALRSEFSAWYRAAHQQLGIHLEEENVPGLLPITAGEQLVISGELAGSIWSYGGDWFPHLSVDGNMLDYLDWYDHWLDSKLYPGIREGVSGLAGTGHIVL